MATDVTYYKLSLSPWKSGSKRTRCLASVTVSPFLSGWEMLPSMLETLQHEMGLVGLVQGIHCALTPEQVGKHRLPRNPDALKPTDTRAKKYMAEFGDLAVELDALPPATLEKIVRETIEEQLDLSQFQKEQEQEESDLETIATLRDKVKQYVEARLT